MSDEAMASEREFNESNIDASHRPVVARYADKIAPGTCASRAGLTPVDC